MNREDIIRMARKAGIDWSGKSAEDVLIRAMQIAYAAGAAAEREACAKVVEDTNEWKGGGWVSTLCRHTKRAIAAAIRARGNNEP